MRLKWISQSAVEPSLRFGSGASPVPTVLPVTCGMARTVPGDTSGEFLGLLCSQQVVYSYPLSDVFFTEHKTSIIMLRELICEEIKRKGEKEIFKHVQESQKNRLKMV